MSIYIPDTWTGVPSPRSVSTWQEGPRHTHLYFYDTDEIIRHIIQRSLNLDEGVIMTILRLLEDNPYICVFRSLGNVANLDKYRIKLNTDIGVDHRRYNVPTVF
jgi:hypothetical protein